MAKGSNNNTTPAGPGVYSATYSGIPVYEFQFGVDLKEHVMRRRHDDWINATHILKAAGFDKPARTRILEREVQKDVHEKIQGGYGKYQGTWIPLEAGEALAQRNNIYDRLRPIFSFVPGNESPPPAPRHTSKPKAPKRPAVPKWTAPAAVPEEPEIEESVIDEDNTPDNLTVASASYMAEEDRHDPAAFSTGHRKRKREEMIQDMTEQQHSVYGDELLDYFLLSRNEHPAIRPEPPINFQPNWVIDTEKHTALHWACAMGDVDVIRQLKRFGASMVAPNIRGETPFMRAVTFTNCFDKQTFPVIMRELFDSVDARDYTGGTVIHHAAIMKHGRTTSQSCARHYLDHILNRLVEVKDPYFGQSLIDAQDDDGNTAIHLAAQKGASKCVRALVGRGASTDIPNRQGVRAEDLIRELNNSKKARLAPQRSSSPFAPESNRHLSFRDALTEPPLPKTAPLQSEAAITVQSRITPLVMEKFADLAANYEEEFKEKDDAERDARAILDNTTADLATVRAQITDLENHMALDPPVGAALVAADAAVARKRVLDLVTHRNRIAVHADVEAAMSMLNGAAAGESDTEEERIRLAGELQAVVAEQRRAEADYVEALGAVGMSDNIEKYKRLLKVCLGPEAESLEDNLDGMIEMMEEEAQDNIAHRAGGDPMEIEVV